MLRICLTKNGKVETIKEKEISVNIANGEIVLYSPLKALKRVVGKVSDYEDISVYEE